MRFHSWITKLITEEMESVFYIAAFVHQGRRIGTMFVR